MKENINFLYCFDTNYNTQAFTSMISLLNNTSRKINIYVIHNEDDFKSKVPNQIFEHRNLIFFESYKFKDYKYDFPNIKNVHISVATYFRLFIKNYLPKKEKFFVFLDPDVICIQDPIDEIENTIEKMQNWTNVDFKKTIKWYDKIRKLNKAKITNIHLEKMKNWTYNKKKGVLYHNSGEFFHIEGKRITNSDREVKNWDQPFIKQIGYKGGIIGLVRALIKGVPHYLVDAKFEPGNYNDIQLSPSLQATYSNLNRVHLGSKPKVANKYFKKNFKSSIGNIN